MNIELQEMWEEVFLAYINIASILYSLLGNEKNKRSLLLTTDILIKTLHAYMHTHTHTHAQTQASALFSFLYGT
jgi:hypothetical protein